MKTDKINSATLFEVVFEHAASADLDRLIREKKIAPEEWWQIDICLSSFLPDDLVENKTASEPPVQPAVSRMVRVTNGWLEIRFSKESAITIHRIIFFTDRGNSERQR